MGSGNYSSTFNASTQSFEYDENIRKTKYFKKGIDLDGMSLHAVGQKFFTNKTLNSSMNPSGVTLRESRDSEEHPNSIALVIALDETGSMMDVPKYMVKEGLPNIMGKIIQKGIQDPQILFLGIGDHECDNAPLQVGQFESNDDLLDKWLTDVYLEGGGGGNSGESYLLAWYFSAFHTSIDCYEKRKIKGMLITIGDEPCLPSIPGVILKRIMGGGQFENEYSSYYLLKEAQKMYDVYHINVCCTGKGRKKETSDSWIQLLGENFILVENQEDISNTIADLIIKQRGNSKISATIDTKSEQEVL